MVLHNADKDLQHTADPNELLNDMVTVYNQRLARGQYEAAAKAVQAAANMGTTKEGKLVQDRKGNAAKGMSEINCYKCGQKGHVQADCTDPPKDKEKEEAKDGKKAGESSDTKSDKADDDEI